MDQQGRRVEGALEISARFPSVRLERQDPEEDHAGLALVVIVSVRPADFDLPGDGIGQVPALAAEPADGLRGLGVRGGEIFGEQRERFPRAACARGDLRPRHTVKGNRAVGEAIQFLADQLQRQVWIPLVVVQMDGHVACQPRAVGRLKAERVRTFQRIQTSLRHLGIPDALLERQALGKKNGVIRPGQAGVRLLVGRVAQEGAAGLKRRDAEHGQEQARQHRCGAQEQGPARGLAWRDLTQSALQGQCQAPQPSRQSPLHVMIQHGHRLRDQVDDWRQGRQTQQGAAGGLPRMGGGQRYSRRKRGDQ